MIVVLIVAFVLYLLLFLVAEISIALGERRYHKRMRELGFHGKRWWERT